MILIILKLLFQNLNFFHFSFMFFFCRKPLFSCPSYSGLVTISRIKICNFFVYYLLFCYTYYFLETKVYNIFFSSFFIVIDVLQFLSNVLNFFFSLFILQTWLNWSSSMHFKTTFNEQICCNIFFCLYCQLYLYLIHNTKPISNLFLFCLLITTIVSI